MCFAKVTQPRCHPERTRGILAATLDPFPGKVLASARDNR
jgi:hypothetical protein